MRRAAGRGATRSPGCSPEGSGRAGQPGRAPTRRRGALGAARLVRREEFDAVYRTGRRRSSRKFTVFLVANGLPQSRFGMSVGRALGGAVIRNRIRRRVREILRLSLVEIAPGWDIVVHPRASVATGDFALLRGELLDLVRNSISADSVPPVGEPPARRSGASAQNEGSGNPSQ